MGLPFAAVHLAIPAVLFVGWSATATVFAAAIYSARALAITVVFHRALRTALSVCRDLFRL